MVQIAWINRKLILQAIGVWRWALGSFWAIGDRRPVTGIEDLIIIHSI